MHTFHAITICFICIMAVIFAGCTQPAGNSQPVASSPGSGPAITGNTATGGAGTWSCSIGPSADPTKNGVLEITSARAEFITNDIIMISGNIRNNGDAATYSGVAGKLCNTRTGDCSKDMVGETFKPRETVEYSLMPKSVCPASGFDSSTCQCEVWIDILR